MAHQLSWDLHVHPGPSSIPRWGTGAEIQAAAERAGLSGFVWKSHEHHTARDCATLLPTPRAIGAAILNGWATPDSVAQAILDGARWVWGSTFVGAHAGWDIALPAEWPAFAATVAGSAEPLVLGTGHLGAEGRRKFAELAAGAGHLQLSVTHSLYLDRSEVEALRDLGAVFEVDMYTSLRPIPGRPPIRYSDGIRALRDWGATVYLTTDFGQLDVGDPYVLSAEVLAGLASDIGEEAVAEVAIANPARVAAHALGDTA